MLNDEDRINSFSQEREAIESRLVNLFDTEKVPVQYSNINFLRKGTETIPTPYKGVSWIRLTVLGGLGTRTEITRSFNQMNGEIIIAIFTRMDAGSDIGRKIADELFVVFNALSFNGIVTGAASLLEVPPNNGWYQLNFSVPYSWQRCLETA